MPDPTSKPASDPSRRDFLNTGILTTASAAVAVAAAPLTASAPRAARPRHVGPPRKAVKLGMVKDPKATKLEARFALPKEVGFDGVELSSPGGMPDPDAVRKAASNTGLVVHGVVDSVHWNKPFSHPDAAVRAEGVKAAEQALRDAKAVGATSVLIVPAVVGKSVSYRDAWTRSQDAIAKLLPLAEELKVSLALENVWNHFLLSPMECARYIDAFNSPWIGAYLDPGNLVVHGWPEHWVECLGTRIFKIDVKDYSRKKLNDEGKWKGFQVKIGEGDTDWPAVRKALQAVGYDDWYTAEVGGGDKTRLKDIATRMDAFLSN